MPIVVILAGLTATPATLPQVIARAKPGDTITLAPGNYPTVIIANRVNDRPVVVDASAATLREVTFRGSAGWTWQGGKIVGPPEQFYGSLIDNSKRIRIVGVTYSGVRVGTAVFRNSENVELLKNRYDGVRSDGINIAGARNVRVVGNTCVNFKPIPPTYDAAGKKLLRDGDHPDCVQAWVVPNHLPTENLYIAENYANGDMQGIFAGSGTRNVTVIRNDLTVSHWHAISFPDSEGLSIRDNRVRTVPGARMKNAPYGPVTAWIRYNVGEACGNQVRDRPKGPESKPCRSKK